MSTTAAKAASVLRRKAVWIPTAVVAALALVYGSAYAYVGGDVPRGTTVRGVDIGGMTLAAAEGKLDEELGGAAKGPVQVRVGGESHELDPAKVGLTFDAKATAEVAGHRSANPVRLARQLVGTEVDPVVRVDEQKLAEAVADMAEKVDQPAREGKVSYDGLEPVTTMPRAGQVVDQKAAARKITEAYPTTSTVQLAVEEQQPKSTAAAVKKVAKDAAVTAVSAPVELGTGKETLSVSRKVLAANTEFVVTGDDGKLKPKIDGKELAKDLGSSLEELETQPKDARFEVKDGEPVVVKSVEGKMVDRKRLGEAVAKVLDENGKRSVSAPIREKKAKLSTAEAKKLGIEEKVSSFTTRHQCCQPRVTNIHRAADILEGKVVKPGEVFSLNEALGQRTRAKGFLPAPMILNGRHVDSVGGGVSQIATTTFNAMFFAGLEDVQHKPHSYYISRYPLGREATISWPQPDLRFKNDSGNGILITTSYTDTSITVTMWGTKRWEIDATEPKKSNYRGPKTIRDDSPDCSPESPGQGYDVTYSRIFKKHGEVVRTEPFRAVYLAPPRVICTHDDEKKKQNDQEKPDERDTNTSSAAGD